MLLLCYLPVCSLLLGSAQVFWGNVEVPEKNKPILTLGDSVENNQFWGEIIWATTKNKPLTLERLNTKLLLTTQPLTECCVVPASWYRITECDSGNYLPVIPAPYIILPLYTFPFLSLLSFFCICLRQNQLPEHNTHSRATSPKRCECLGLGFLALSRVCVGAGCRTWPLSPEGKRSHNGVSYFYNNTAIILNRNGWYR